MGGGGILIGGKIEYNGANEEEPPRVRNYGGEGNCARDCEPGKMWLTITGWYFSAAFTISCLCCFPGEARKERVWHEGRRR